MSVFDSPAKPKYETADIDCPYCGAPAGQPCVDMRDADVAPKRYRKWIYKIHAGRR
jgi:hypothetical protein